MLPHEAEVMAEIATKYHVQFEAMTALHDAVVSMMTGGSWTVRERRGLARFVAETMVGLLTKACKTFRAIHILCERGLHEDASALVRVLMETTIAVAFILQKSSKERAIIYHAHGIAQQMKMLNEWKTTRGLKRKAPKAILEQANQAFANSLKRIPPRTDVKRHWSGKRTLREAMKALRGGRVRMQVKNQCNQVAGPRGGCRATHCRRRIACRGAAFDISPQGRRSFSEPACTGARRGGDKVRRSRRLAGKPHAKGA